MTCPRPGSWLMTWVARNPQLPFQRFSMESWPCASSRAARLGTERSPEQSLSDLSGSTEMGMRVPGALPVSPTSDQPVPHPPLHRLSLPQHHRAHSRHPPRRGSCDLETRRTGVPPAVCPRGQLCVPGASCVSPG